VEGTCFQDATVGRGRRGTATQVTSSRAAGGAVEVTIHLGAIDAILCHAGFILATDKHLVLKELWLPGDHVVTFPAIPDSTPAEDWDLYDRRPATPSSQRTSGAQGSSSTGSPLRRCPPRRPRPAPGHLQPRRHARPLRALSHPGGRRDVR
jgi:hypothetical protein